MFLVLWSCDFMIYVFYVLVVWIKWKMSLLMWDLLLEKVSFLCLSCFRFPFLEQYFLFVVFVWLGINGGIWLFKVLLMDLLWICMCLMMYEAMMMMDLIMVMSTYIEVYDDCKWSRTWNYLVWIDTNMVDYLVFGIWCGNMFCGWNYEFGVISWVSWGDFMVVFL